MLSSTSYASNGNISIKTLYYTNGNIKQYTTYDSETGNISTDQKCDDKGTETYFAIYNTKTGYKNYEIEYTNQGYTKTEYNSTTGIAKRKYTMHKVNDKVNTIAHSINYDNNGAKTIEQTYATTGNVLGREKTYCQYDPKTGNKILEIKLGTTTQITKFDPTTGNEIAKTSKNYEEIPVSSKVLEDIKNKKIIFS